MFLWIIMFLLLGFYSSSPFKYYILDGWSHIPFAQYYNYSHNLKWLFYKNVIRFYISQQVFIFLLHTLPLQLTSFQSPFIVNKISLFQNAHSKHTHVILPLTKLCITFIDTKLQTPSSSKHTIKGATQVSGHSLKNYIFVCLKYHKWNIIIQIVIIFLKYFSLIVKFTCSKFDTNLKYFCVVKALKPRE
jgi:hypothetical protein